MLEMNDVHIENDKTNAPYLLALSFCGLIEFLGSYSEKGIVYWKFSPKRKAIELIDNFHTKTEPHIPSRDLFEAIETFWRQVSMARNGEMKHGFREK